MTINLRTCGVKTLNGPSLSLRNVPHIADLFCYFHVSIERAVTRFTVGKWLKFRKGQNNFLLYSTIKLKPTLRSKAQDRIINPNFGWS